MFQETENFSIFYIPFDILNVYVLMCSTQIDARKEQLALAKTELKQAK